MIENLTTKKKIKIKDFSNYIFWDIDVSQLDIDRDRQFIIKRVLEYGKLEDWMLIKEYYSIDVIGQEMQETRSLEPLSLSFVSMVTGLKKESFRCYTMKQFY